MYVTHQSQLGRCGRSQPAVCHRAVQWAWAAALDTICPWKDSAAVAQYLHSTCYSRKERSPGMKKSGWELCVWLLCLTRFQTTASLYVADLQPLDLCAVWSFKWNTTHYNSASNNKHENTSHKNTGAKFICDAKAACAISSCFFRIWCSWILY